MGKCLFGIQEKKERFCKIRYISKDVNVYTTMREKEKGRL